MKKKSRFLTGLLSAVMALSLFALPASAADVVVNPSTIDTGKTGTIMIHKYEYNGTNQGKGTGEATDTVPSGATALDDVTFELYQVLDSENLIKYYNNIQDNTGFSNVTDTKGNALTGPLTGTDAWQHYAKEKDAPAVGYEWIPNAISDNTSLKTTVTTKNGGVATASVGVGLYLVIETNAPSQVTKPATPFFVSVPMTRENAQGNTEWLYTIDVFPKNGTTYGEVSVVKNGYIGSENSTWYTSGDKNADLLEGVEFYLYRFVGEGDTTPYVAGSDNWERIVKSTQDGKDIKAVTDANGKFSVSGLPAGDYCFVEQNIGSEDKNGAYIIDQQPIYFQMNNNSTSQRFKFEGNTKTMMGQAGAKNLEIVVNNYRPDVEKQVKNGEGAYGEKADYSVRDYVPYKVTVTVPENIENLKTFVVTDTPTNLEFIEDEEGHVLEVKGETGNKTFDRGTTENPKDYTVEKNITTGGFDLTFTSASLVAYKGQNIVITYYAKLKDSAKTTVAGNPNTITLKYTNKINSDGTPADGSEKEITDDAVVYSFGIHIKKTNESGKGLNGVTFDLYRVATDDDDSENIVDGSKFGLDSSVKLVLVKKNLKTENVDDVDGIIKCDGLANDTYYLVETKTLDGYNLLSKAIKVELRVSYKETWKECAQYENGKLVHHHKEHFTEKFTGGDTEDAGYITTTVINRKGFDLPVTGGFGTLLFSCIGALLVVGGVGVLMSTKKKKKGNA